MTSEFGIGLFAVADGSYRSAANASRLYFYLSGDKKRGDGLPGNFGGLIGAAIDGNYNLDRPGGKYQNGLSLINDATTMYFTGTTWNASAINSLAASAGAISDTYTILYTYFSIVH